MNGRVLMERIIAYGQRAINKQLACPLAVCPCCGGWPARFGRHGVRKRQFLVFVQEVIEEVDSYLTRWKCPLCRRTFTQYPWWAIPNKRYVLPFIEERCEAYVEDTARTYAAGVRTEEGLPFSHADAEAGRELAASTLWHWHTTLGGMSDAMRGALELIKQQDPSTGVFRELGLLQIRAAKYRCCGRWPRTARRANCIWIMPRYITLTDSRRRVTD